MKHKKLLIFTTCLVFIMTCIVGLNQLFSVNDITVVYSVASVEVTEEVLSLLEKYKGESMFKVELSEISKEITSNRYLKVVSVEKKFPNEIVVNLTQRLEKYYYTAQDATYYFDEEYFIVRKSELPPEKENYLTEFAFEDINGNFIETDCALKSTFEFPTQFVNDVTTVIEELSSVSTNVTKIAFVVTPEEGNYRVELQMREGVVIEIRKAGQSLQEKLISGIEFYKKLEESRKISGFIYVQINDKGNITANHSFGN